LFLLARVLFLFLWAFFKGGDFLKIKEFGDLFKKVSELGFRSLSFAFCSFKERCHQVMFLGFYSA
jgi:hypothetical protein